MFRASVPVLHVSSSAAAEHYYCRKLGFEQRFSYRNDDRQADPCYQGLARDGVWLHVSSFPGDGVAGGVVNIEVDEIDRLYEELKSKGVAIALEPTDQTWGNREMYLVDPDGNSIRFIQDG